MESFSSHQWLSASVIALILTILLLIKCINGKNNTTKRTPPGPPAWPVVGNMFDLGSMPHHELYKLGKKYGPVIWLKLGSVNTMVIQSSSAAADLFKNHDLAFCDRKVPDALTAWGYHEGSLALSNYGPYWRRVRKVCSMELLVNKRVNESSEIREKCVEKLIHWIEEDAMSSKAQGRSSVVELPHYIFLMAFNVLGNLMLSRDLLDIQSLEGREFFKATSKIVEWAGTPNVADFLPFLKRFDPIRVKKNMLKDMGTAIKTASTFVKDRVRENKSSKVKLDKDFLDVLMEYEDNSKEEAGKFSEKNITIIILEMFFGGSETTSSTIEWAITELLRNPESMRKVKEELDSVLVNSKRIKESDMEILPYLQAVVKETLRLHPAIPLLLPRYSREDTDFLGYQIPKHTQVFINVWAIGRDPNVWEDALSFKPERFLGSDIDYKGQHYDLLPFGSGRRVCVGMALGERVVHLALANLFWYFDWELDSSTTPSTMNMAERMGMTLRKLEPLRAIPNKKRYIQG